MDLFLREIIDIEPTHDKRNYIQIAIFCEYKSGLEYIFDNKDFIEAYLRNLRAESTEEIDMEDFYDSYSPHELRIDPIFIKTIQEIFGSNQPGIYRPIDYDGTLMINNRVEIITIPEEYIGYPQSHILEFFEEDNQTWEELTFSKEKLAYAKIMELNPEEMSRDQLIEQIKMLQALK